MEKNKYKTIAIIMTVLVVILISVLGVKKMIEPTQHEKQVSFLKKHENEMTKHIQEKNPESDISYVNYDWNSFNIEDSGAFTQRLYTIDISLYDKNKKKFNGGIIGIIPDDIDTPTKIIAIATNNFDQEIGVDDNG